MKAFFPLLFFPLFLLAQLPKGDRVLAYQIDMAENSNYDSAVAYAQAGCMESIHFFFPWSSIQPRIDSFSQSYITSTLASANTYFSILNKTIELQLGPVNTTALEVPEGLENKSFSSGEMIYSFRRLIDTLFTYMPDVKFASLNIGNESDIYFGTRDTSYAEFKIFLDSIIPYAKLKYKQIHNEDLKVGTTLTYKGLLDPQTMAYCAFLNSITDITSLTYYPINDDFTMKDPSVVVSDFDSLVKYYPDTVKPFYFTECGYSSSPVCNSSDLKQAQFFEEVFKGWDKHQDRIKYLTIFKTTDWSQAEVDEFKDYYGISSPTFLEYLRALGVRTYPSDGENKPAYYQILCELKARGFCNANCLTVDVNHYSSPFELKINNPVEHEIRVNIDHSKEIDFSILNLKGTKVKSGKMKNKFNVSDLSPGSYFLVIDQRIKRFIKK